MADTTITMTGTPAAGYVGVAYSFQPSATGGTTASYVWSATGLPDGLSINATSGKISGTPTAAATSPVVISLTDGTNNQTLDVSIAVNPAVTLSGTPVGAIVGTTYHFTPTVKNQLDGSTLTVSLASGTLPAGTELDPTTGNVFGTPTVAGTSNFSLTVTDGNTTSTVPFTVTVVQPLTITTATLPEASLDASYSTTLAYIGASQGATVTWSLVDGDLPLGLILSTAGVLSGTPLEEGDELFTVMATSSDGETATKDFTLDVVDNGAAEAEGKTPQQVMLETSLQAYATILTGVETPTPGQLTNAAAALDRATQTLIRTTTTGMLASAVAFVRTNSSLFNAGNLPRGLNTLGNGNARAAQTLWSEIYKAVITPELPVNVAALVRDTRRMPFVTYLRGLRQ